MKKNLKIISIILISLLISQSIIAVQYGQVVRFQCDRTGQYLSFDPAVDTNGEYKVILSDQTTDDTLWVIKGPISGPVDGANPYDRWNCTFGNDVPASGYEARIEHLLLGLDARFGDYLPEETGQHTNPYSFLLGQTKIGNSGAIHYYNIVLNLHGENKMLISNEYLCASSDSHDAIVTQDATVDTWTIVPVYAMTEDQKDLAGQDLLDGLTTGTVSVGNSEQELADHLTEDVSALISFYNNEIAYCQEVQNAFATMAVETDINVRISIAQSLEAYTTTYNDQKATIFSAISHPVMSELVQCIQDGLGQNKINITDLQTIITSLESAKATLEGEKQVLTDELNTISTDLSAIGATSVPDLTAKIDQLVSALTALWQTS